MEDKELVKKVREIALEFPENDMKRALLLGITDRFVGVKVNSIPISVIQNKIDEYREKRNKLADGHFWDNERNINEDTSLFIAIETLKLLLEERNK